MRTATIGVGAIAGTLAGFMAKAGNDVLMIDSWKEHVETMNEKGLILDGIVGDHLVKVNAIHTDEIPNISDTFDMVIVGVKSYDTENAIKAMLPFMNEETCVVSPQNSINETLIAPVSYTHLTLPTICSV